MRWITRLLLLAACALVGCEKTEMAITLNPDGGGKLRYETTRPLSAMFSMGNQTEQPPAVRARQMVENLLKHSEGIEAWSDISYTYDEVADEVSFSGTAYFRDFNQVRLTVSKGVRTSTSDLRVEREGERLVVVMGEAKEEKTAKAAGDPPTGEALERRIAQAKAQVERQLTAIQPMLQDLRKTYIVHLPGPATQAINFEQVNPTTVRLVQDGGAMLEAMRGLLEDDAFWREQVQQGGSLSDFNQDALYGRMYGQPAAPRVVVEGQLASQFDFAAELQVAQADFAEAMEELGFGTSVLPPAQGEGFTRLDVVGVSWLHDTEVDRQALPVGMADGYQLAMIGKLPGSVLTLEELTLQTAVDDSGKNLLPDHSFHQLNLGEDKSTAGIALRLRPPADEATGIRTIEGIVIYTVAGGATSHDFGLVPLQPGALEGAVPLTLEKVEDSQWRQGQQEISFKLQMPAYQFKGLELFDADGAALPLESGSSWTMNETLQKTFRYAGTLPDKAQVKLHLHTDVKRYKIPLQLRDLDLVGRHR